MNASKQLNCLKALGESSAAMDVFARKFGRFGDGVGVRDSHEISLSFDPRHIADGFQSSRNNKIKQKLQRVGFIIGINRCKNAPHQLLVRRYPDPDVPGASLISGKPSRLIVSTVYLITALGASGQREELRLTSPAG
jgi:hypothetical protein